jgi:glycosyltransferase 2 family protein
MDLERSAVTPERTALALGYKAFDVQCLILLLSALGVADNSSMLLIAHGVATALAAIPLTPGGIRAFEVTMLAPFVPLRAGVEAMIPILGYRLFKLWLPIPLAAVFYPTFQCNGRDCRTGG